MPACRAISSVEAPWRPWRPNSTSAASRISSRRSSADFRSWTTMRGRLVTAYKLVKCLRDAIEVRVAEPAVQRQREGGLEGVPRAREVALVAVGAEQVQRVGPDLRLDPLCPQLGEHTVAVVDLHDVRLPAVD